ERLNVALVVDAAGTGRDDLALLRLLLGGVGNDDPADTLLLFFQTGHEDAITKRTDVHGALPVQGLLRLSPLKVVGASWGPHKRVQRDRTRFGRTVGVSGQSANGNRAFFRGALQAPRPFGPVREEAG